jgi:CHRD domain
MRRKNLISVMALAGISALLAASAIAGGYGSGSNRGRDQDRFRVQLKGFEEVPVIVTDGNGELRLVVNAAAGTIDYQLGYDSLEGNVTQAHIHVGQPNVTGGISLWLCQTAASPAPASVTAITPDCGGPHTGNVSGTLTSANVIGPAGQGVAAGELGDVITAIRAGRAYGNVHSTLAPGGEIRGQLVH